MAERAETCKHGVFTFLPCPDCTLKSVVPAQEGQRRHDERALADLLRKISNDIKLARKGAAELSKEQENEHLRAIDIQIVALSKKVITIP